MPALRIRSAIFSSKLLWRCRRRLVLTLSIHLFIICAERKTQRVSIRSYQNFRSFQSKRWTKQIPKSNLGVYLELKDAERGGK
jgi:hypothetical protein